MLVTNLCIRIIIGFASLYSIKLFEGQSRKVKSIIKERGVHSEMSFTFSPQCDHSIKCYLQYLHKDLKQPKLKSCLSFRQAICCMVGRRPEENDYAFMNGLNISHLYSVFQVV